ncbi:PREDICTED: facilitated trehalose transporter Tret1-like [Papilio polytes]|uniref:facilitated trehalose transporter Tret1-like n=1 Tax=Papilio polytes TaxID=76194 RepID=UPI000675E511|nr:PREDICTED: facilitated trehalose transporter Tret1-like [Papilio polytes]
MLLSRKLLFSPEPGILRQYAVVIFVNLSVLTTGMSVAWPSPMLVKLTNATETPLYRTITEEEGSWIVSIGFLCTVFTNILLGMLIDSIGRKYCVIIACVPKIIVSIIYIFASDVWMLILGRALIGVTDSFVFTVVPIYSSEIASKEMRGSLGTFLQIFSSLGIVVTLSVGPYTSYTTFNTVFAVINVVAGIPLLFLPDSPFFLYAKGKTNDAHDVLKLLRGNDQLAKEEIASYALSTDNKVDKIALLKNRVVLKSLGVAMLLCAGSQLVGFNAVSFYLQTILVSTRTKVKPEIASVVIGVIQLFASFCTTVMMERFKRKQILISSLIGMLIGLVGLGAFFKIREDAEVQGFLNYLPLISLILVVYCYSAGMGSLIWVLTAELFDGPARAFGVSISLIINTLSVFLTTKYFSTLTTVLGPAVTYWWFSGCCFITCIFIHYCVPETKGKTFREIQEYFEGDRTKKDFENS